MSIRKTMKKACGTGLVLGVCMLSGSAFATDPDPVALYNDSFEGYDAGSTSTEWGSNGTVMSGGSSVTADTSPVTNIATFAKSLAVTGTVTRSQAISLGSYTGVKADFMVKVTKPDEVLADDTIASPSDVQIAIAANYVDSGKVPLYIWTKTNDTLTGWAPLNKSFTEGDWTRVTLLFDYTNKRVQVMVGSAVCTNSTCGYTASTGTTKGGSWYAFSNATSPTTLNSISVVGTTAIDDVAVAATDMSDPKPFPEGQTEAVTVAGQSINVEKNDMAKWGVDATTITTTKDPQNTSMTYSQEIAAGIVPESGTNLVVTKMETTSTQVKLTVPALTPLDGYKNVIIKNGDNDNPITINGGASEVSIDLPAVDAKAPGTAVKHTYQIKTITDDGLGPS